MEAFGRELDELEEVIVYLALVFLVSSAVAFLFAGPIVFLAGLASSLSLLAGIVALGLWVLRRVGSPLYDRLRGPESSRIQPLFASDEKTQKDTTTEDV